MIKQENAERPMLELPRRQARPVPLPAPGRRRKLPVVSQPARFVHTKLLNEKVPNLCQDCHDWSRHPGTAYSGDQGFVRIPGSKTTTPNTRFVSRSCLNCHNAIHGSNASATRGKYLTR